MFGIAPMLVFKDMGMLRNHKKFILFIFILYCLLNIDTMFCQPYPWLKRGSYFIYKVYTYKPMPFYLLKWEVVNISGNFAYIKITLLNYSKSCVVKVNILTREVYMNDRKIGITYMFFKRYPGNEKDEIIFKYKEKIIKIPISIETRTYAVTLKGIQKAYYCNSDNFTFLYDYDTGILIEGSIGYLEDTAREAFFKAMDAIGIYLFSTYDEYTLYDTNVDLGPPDITYTIKHFISENFPLILFIAALISSIIFLYRRRRKITT